jgi:hypothetical protein
MDYDISRLLEDWEYQSGQVVVRRFQGRDGKEKIQLRVDLGLLQMNAEGRPDGKQPWGYPSLLEHYQARLHQHVGAHEGSGEGFRLGPDDCGRLQLEFLQYYHRCICLHQLKDYAAVVRDAERNLAALNLVAKYAASEELAWGLRQFEPQLIMVLTRARGEQALAVEDYALAEKVTEEGLEHLRTFYANLGNPEAAEQSGEVQALTGWIEEIRSKRPLSERERLERALQEAVNREDYERAARVRDALRNLKPTDR